MWRSRKVEVEVEVEKAQTEALLEEQDLDFFELDHE